MHTITNMREYVFAREYINEYVRSQPLHRIGYELLRDHFGVPFNHDDDFTYSINHVAMGEDDTEKYIREFFEGLDVPAVMDLYHKIAV